MCGGGVCADLDAEEGLREAEAVHDVQQVVQGAVEDAVQLLSAQRHRLDHRQDPCVEHRLEDTQTHTSITHTHSAYPSKYLCRYTYTHTETQYLSIYTIPRSIYLSIYLYILSVTQRTG